MLRSLIAVTLTAACVDALAEDIAIRAENEEFLRQYAETYRF